MTWRLVVYVGLVTVAVSSGLLVPATAQRLTSQPEPLPGSDGWRAQSAVQPAQAETDLGAASDGEGRYSQGPAQGAVRVSRGSGSLPNDHGQIWREYDISPYTSRVAASDRPEQAVVDWILRETGYESWHGEVVALLSANRQTLRAYHTPEMQAVIAEIVDRFVDSRSESRVFGLRVITLRNPNWRSKALRLMRPVPVQSQGVQGWLMAREDAALLLAELKQRTDFREHSSPQMAVQNGQTAVVSAIRPRSFVRSVILAAGAWPGYTPDVAQLEEGYSLGFTPLLSLDGQTVDAVIKLELSQVERMVPVMLDVPTPAAPRQRVRVEVPQASTIQLHERFRWPESEVLLLSLGVVATPEPAPENTLTSMLSLPTAPPRADALLFVESRGALADAANGSSVAGPPSPGVSGRY
jgi:hypothetical protein